MISVKELLEGLDQSSLTEEQLRKIALLKAEEVRLRNDGLIWAYKPQPQQQPFHENPAKKRWVFGGNRSGKSICAHADAVWLALGKHPYRKDVPVPNHGWIVSVDFPTSRSVSEKLIWDYLPKSAIKTDGWSKSERIIYLKNGSSIGFKSCDSGPEKFQGTSRNWILFDEEPKYDVYQECLMRLIDTNGLVICAETPTLGLSWTYDEIVEQAGINKNIATFYLSMLKNPYLTKEAVDEALLTMNPEERAMRVEGKHIQLSGLVFKEYDRDVHVVKGFPIPDGWDWSKFRGIDHGTNNPTACIWAAINKENELYIYDEYYEEQKTISENCSAIKSITGGDKLSWTAIDGSTKSVNSVDKKSYYEEYKKNGIYARPIYLNEVNIRLAIDDIRSRLMVSEKTKKPKMYIFDHCHNFLKEFSRYRWRTYRLKDEKNPPDKPQGYMDHAITALMFIVLSKARWEGLDRMQEEPEVVKWY